jgi:hypothetical protein
MGQSSRCPLSGDLPSQSLLRGEEVIEKVHELLVVHLLGGFRSFRLRLGSAWLWGCEGVAILCWALVFILHFNPVVAEHIP